MISFKKTNVRFLSNTVNCYDIQLFMLIFVGVAVDSPDNKDITIIKKSGKVQALQDEILSSEL